jgi:hypothetical protein
MNLEREGGCLCGAVRFKARVEPGIGACHCMQCQRWTGGGPLFWVRARDLKLMTTGSPGTYRASKWGERVFCSTCGSTLWWKMQGKPITAVAVGLLDDQSGLSVAEEIFADCRPGWLPAWKEASQSTEAEEQAKLAAFLSGETK